MQPEHISLKFKQGSSNKIYNASLQELDGGWVVNFAYGRVGKPLRAGTKTKTPVPYDQALGAYRSLVREKKAKGYSADVSGKPFQGDEKAGEITGWLPQLLNPVDDDQLRDTFSEWADLTYLQVKHDGERRGIIRDKNETIPSNRRGLRTNTHPRIEKDLKKLFKHFDHNCVLDCEDMGEHLVIFDIIMQEGIEVFHERAHFLHQVQQICLSNKLRTLRVDVPLKVSSLQLLEECLAQAREDGEEGIVIRNGMSTYSAGRPNSGGDALKYKFYESATCIVESVHPTKSSIGLCLWHDHEKVTVGNCTIPPNYEIPQPGQLVEIKYLYAYRGGSIYQPQYKGVRGDLDESAASLDQLKFKE